MTKLVGIVALLLGLAVARAQDAAINNYFATYAEQQGISLTDLEGGGACPTAVDGYGCGEAGCDDAVVQQCQEAVGGGTRRLDDDQNHRKLDFYVGTLDFEGINFTPPQISQPVGSFYPGITFSLHAEALSSAVGSFIPLSQGVVLYNTQNFATYINVADGFTSQLSFKYSSPLFPGFVQLYDAGNNPLLPNDLAFPPGLGKILSTTTAGGANNPPLFQNFASFSIAFVGTAVKIKLTGLPNFILFDDISLGIPADQTPPPVGPSGDPWMLGFQGQRFFFDGEDAKWYNCISDPIKKININMRMSRLKGFGTFTDGVGIVVMGENDVKHTIALTVAVDKTNFNPECKLAVKEGEDEPVCLGDGAVTLVVDGVTYASPGHVLVEDGFNIYAVNAPFACKKIPDAHYHWEEQVAHMGVVAQQEEAQEADSRRRRKLLTADARTLLDYLMSERGMFDEVTCVEWAVDRLTENDLYAQSGSYSTIFIDSPIFSLRIEYTRNEDETTWAKHHRFDWFLSNYHPYRNGGGGSSVGGILGETGVIQHDRTGLPILGDRFSILSGPKDSDYEVQGPYGDDFLAAKRY